MRIRIGMTSLTSTNTTRCGAATGRTIIRTVTSPLHPHIGTPRTSTIDTTIDALLLNLSLDRMDVTDSHPDVRVGPADPLNGPAPSRGAHADDCLCCSRFVEVGQVPPARFDAALTPAVAAMDATVLE